MQRASGISVHLTGHYCSTVHVALKQFIDVAKRENIGVGDHGASGIAHQLRHRKSQRRERLQVVVVPDSLLAFAQVLFPFKSIERRKLWRLNDPNVEPLRRCAVTNERVSRDQRTDDLLWIGMNEDAVSHP